MLIRQQGIGLLLILMILFSNLIFLQSVVKHLSLLGHEVYLWQIFQKEKQDMQDLAKKLINQSPDKYPKPGNHSAQTFDYSWHFLGEYACIVICKPKCLSTGHWLLKIKSQHHGMYFRVAIPIEKMRCAEKYKFKLKTNMMLYRETKE
jgi:hypothetical protein